MLIMAWIEELAWTHWGRERRSVVVVVVVVPKF